MISTEARRDAPAEIARVLAPVDLSADSPASVLQALELGRRLGAFVVVMTAVADADVAAGRSHGDYLDQVIETRRMRLVAWFATRVPEEARRGARVTFVAVPGAPARAIVEAARAEKADLIVMATHERAGLRRWTHRSIARAVARAAPIPVLTVRPDHVRFRAAV